jgi:DNA polymerase-4
MGLGGTTVDPTPHVARSRSRETTFQVDIDDRAEIERQVGVLAHRVTQDVVDEGRPAARVAVKVRFVPFFTQIRSMTLPAPTTDPDEIERAAIALLDRFDRWRPVRLLGVRAELTRPD